MSEKDAHICISITCIRYLMLCAAIMAERLPDIKAWTSQHFKECAQYLHEMPILCYLVYHIEGCQRDAYVLDIASNFLGKLTENPAAHLLQNWAYSHFNDIFFENKLSGVGTVLPNKTLYAAVKGGYLTATGVSLILGADINVETEGKKDTATTRS